MPKTATATARTALLDLLGLLLFTCIAFAALALLGCGDSAGGTSGGSSGEGNGPTDVGATGYCLDENYRPDPNVCAEGTACVAAGACMPKCETAADCAMYAPYEAVCDTHPSYPEVGKHCQILCEENTTNCPAFDDLILACGTGFCLVHEYDP